MMRVKSKRTLFWGVHWVLWMLRPRKVLLPYARSTFLALYLSKDYMSFVYCLNITIISIEAPAIPQPPKMKAPQQFWVSNFSLPLPVRDLCWNDSSSESPTSLCLSQFRICAEMGQWGYAGIQPFKFRVESGIQSWALIGFLLWRGILSIPLWLSDNSTSTCQDEQRRKLFMVLGSGF
jgi:hypothetical protein